jgi:glucoamylase
MENSTGASRLIPEQVWDTTDIPERELFAGKGVGLGVPAGVGAFRIHQAAPVAGRRKDFRSAAANGGAVFEKEDVREFFNWRFNNKTRSMPRGKKLRILLMDRQSCTGVSTTGKRVRTASPGKADGIFNTST